MKLPTDFGRQMAKKTEEVNRSLYSYLPDEDVGIVSDAMCYSVKAGGKRLRPILLLEVCRLFTEDEETLKTAMCFAAALELIHTYSLVHDDLPAMDNDEYRRGKLTTHAKYGEAFGILAGDALLNEAFLLCAKEIEALATRPNALLLNRATKALRILAECAGNDGMIRGQEIDLASEGKEPDQERILLMYELKTARLLEAAFTVGAVLGGCDEAQREAAFQAASALGRAFQLRDDILDRIGDERKLGKPVNSDMKNEKSTYVALVGIEETEQEVMRLTQDALECLEQLPGQKDFLKALLMSLVEREH